MKIEDLVPRERVFHTMKWYLLFGNIDGPYESQLEAEIEASMLKS
jgi:hypothetical protein